MERLVIFVTRSISTKVHELLLSSDAYFPSNSHLMAFSHISSKLVSTEFQLVDITHPGEHGIAFLVNRQVLHLQKDAFFRSQPRILMLVRRGLVMRLENSLLASWERSCCELMITALPFLDISRLDTAIDGCSNNSQRSWL